MISKPILDVCCSGANQLPKISANRNKSQFCFSFGFTYFWKCSMHLCLQNTRDFSTFPQLILKIITQCADIFNANG